LRSARGDRQIAPAGPPAAIDARRVELVLACLVAGGTFLLGARLLVVPSLLVPVLAVYAAALLRRWSPAGRLAVFLLLLAVVGVAPTLLNMDATHTGSPTSGHDGGVIVTGRAVEELLTGNDPYTVSYADELRGGSLIVDGLRTENPIRDHYPYSPGTFLLQVPFVGAALALGLWPDPRWLYLLVYAALAVGLARWSLRERGDLLVPLLLLANPLFLPFLWMGETDILLLAGLVGLVWALARKRPVAGALALGLALSTKLLLAPLALVVLAWLLAGARQGRLARSTAVRAAGALALPAVVTAAPFLLWHPGAIVEDVLLFHAGLAPSRYPISGAGFPALLFDLDVVHDRWAAAPPWSTLLPTVAALAAAGAWVWRRTRVTDLLAAGAAASLAAVYFSRAFTTTYWWLPVALLSLTALAGPHPRPPAVAAGDPAGPVAREPADMPAPAAAVAAAVPVPERASRPAR
jgi:Glycosyltransferase family 87